jgi:hypothetical protein
MKENVAQLLKADREKRGVTPNRQSVLTIVSDDYSLHCITEDMLDEWWRSLPAEQKAAIYEADLNSDQSVAASAKIDSFIDGWEALNKMPIELALPSATSKLFHPLPRRTLHD